jgi:thioredoxin reductase
MASMDFEWDCIVAGGGPAGLSAALMLGRARRRVLVLDSGEPRNYAAHEMHGVLGHDGLPPADLRARGAEELSRYGIEVLPARIGEVRASAEGVEVDGMAARTLILATGMTDDTPPVTGFDEIYGVSAHTCPYCDGWEHRDSRIAVLAAGDTAVHFGGTLRVWSPDVVVVTNGADTDETALAAVDVPVVREPIERFVSDDGRLTAIEFAGRPPLKRDALFFNIGMHARAELAVALGCELDQNGYVVADPMLRQTSVQRVYAAGNCTNPMLNVPMSIGDGARAAIGVSKRLIDERVLQPVAARAG